VDPPVTGALIVGKKETTGELNENPPIRVPTTAATVTAVELVAAEAPGGLMHDKTEVVVHAVVRHILTSEAVISAVGLMSPPSKLIPCMTTSAPPVDGPL